MSIHWKGKPFLTIEHVVRYVNETTTHSKTRPNNLRVECWFEPKKYQTNKEKKANGEAILTRAELEKIANGRITHPFPEGTDQYKWNYTITPSV